MIRRLVPLLLGLAACSSPFDPPSRITKLRLLAVSADRSYARPGESVSLEALAVDPYGRTITFGWATCTNPAAASVMGCLASMDRSTFVIGTNKHVVTVPAGAKVDAAAMIGVIVVACPGKLSTSNGEVPFRCDDLGTDAFEVGMKRVLVRARDRNENPRIDEVTFDGKPWASDFVPEVSTCAEQKADDCAGAHSIAVRASRVEEGVDELGITFTEQLVVQYYATEGTFGSDSKIASAPETKWIARPHTSGSTIDMFLVARDDRGGVTWTTRKVRVR